MLHELQNNTTKWTLLGGSPSSVPGRPAYALLMDEQHQRLVLAIRGTSTLADALTDIIGTSVPFGASGGASDGGAVGSNSKVAHSGFVLGSKNVLSHITPILDKTLKEHAIQEMVVVGHSLGAGVASIATVALAEQYPELVDNQRLTCSAFACPPSMSLALSNTTTEYITSIVHSDDCICSASIHSFVHLFNELMTSSSYICASFQSLCTETLLECLVRLCDLPGIRRMRWRDGKDAWHHFVFCYLQHLHPRFLEYVHTQELAAD